MGLFLAAFFVLPVTFAWASEPLSFMARLSDIEKFQIQRDAGIDPHDFRFAKVDLNRDGLDELISVSAACKVGEEFCSFSVYGQGLDRFQEILKVEARSLTVSNEESFGVRDLSVFQSRINHYKAQRYVWNAAESRYTVHEERDGS